MISNYIKIAWRGIVKNTFYSFINIIGLSVGVAFTLIIAVYVWGELRVNSQLKNADNQYILLSKWSDPNMGFEICSSAELPAALKRSYPNLVKNYLRWDGVTSTISKGDKHFREGILLVDSTMLNMYGFKLLYGNSKTALNDPFSVIITADRAIKYFGHLDVIGQTLSIENFSGSKHDFIVSGVLDKMTKNSVAYLNDDTTNEFFVPSGAAKYMGRDMQGWNNTGLVSYLELQDGVDPQKLGKPIKQLLNNYAEQQISKNVKMRVVPLKQYYLSANNKLVCKMIYTLSAIAIFILLMAVINFINLCISRSSTRMREIGVRKVLGGLSKQLIAQFLIESTLLVLLSTLIAIGLFFVFRPFFVVILNKDITGFFELPILFYVSVFSVSVLIGLLAGIYPAFVLSSLKSVDSLKGKLSSVDGNVFVRKALLALQFGTAVVVFIGAIVISKQVNLFFSNDLGYNKDLVVTAQVPRDWSKSGVQKMETIRYQFERMPQVKSASLSWEIPNGANGGSVSLFRLGGDSSKAITSQQLAPDNKYADTYSIPVKAGRFFSSGTYNEANAHEIVINETAAKALGWKIPAQAIEQKVKMIDGGINIITGVVADFHFGSMQQPIHPLLFLNVNATTHYRYLSFKLKPGNVEADINALQQKWASVLPGAPFDYNFMDSSLQKVYKTEIQLKKAAYVATALAIIIALLGVIGLISLSIQKRAKEIGIRKVLGSSVPGIIALFIKEFIVVIIISGLIACPLAYLLMQQWLNDYAYKITIGINPFIISIGILTTLTALLITMQSVKIALVNPVKSLRSE